MAIHVKEGEDWILSAGPTGNSKLKGDFIQCGKEGSWGEFGETPGLIWTYPDIISSVNVSPLGKFETKLSKNGINNLVNNLNLLFSKEKYDYFHGPNSNTFIKYTLFYMGKNDFMPGSYVRGCNWNFKH